MWYIRIRRLNFLHTLTNKCKIISTCIKIDTSNIRQNKNILNLSDSTLSIVRYNIMWRN